MSQFHSLIRSRDSHLNPQILLFVEFIGTTTSMPDLTNGWLEYVTCTNKTHKNLLFIMYIVFFEDNYIFVNNFNTSPRSYKCIPWNCNNKVWRAEGQEKQIPGIEKNKYTSFTIRFLSKL